MLAKVCANEWTTDLGNVTDQAIDEHIEFSRNFDVDCLACFILDVSDNAFAVFGGKVCDSPVDGVTLWSQQGAVNELDHCLQLERCQREHFPVFRIGHIALALCLGVAFGATCPHARVD